MKVGETIYNAETGCTLTLVSAAQKSGTNPDAVKIEKEIRAGKMAADFRILDFNGGVRKFAFMADNITNVRRWYSKKEHDAIRAAGKTIVTDF